MTLPKVSESLFETLHATRTLVFNKEPEILAAMKAENPVLYEMAMSCDDVENANMAVFYKAGFLAMYWMLRTQLEADEMNEMWGQS